VEADVAARLRLRGVRFHRRGPRGDDGGIRNIHQHRRAVGGLGLDGDGVEHELLDGVRLEFQQLRDAAVTREARRVAHHAADDDVIGVLVLHRSRR
jgi:hypothetical protein